MYYNTRIWLLSLIDSSFCIKTDRSHKLLETGWWRNILSWLCLQSLTLRTYINLMVDTKRIFWGENERLYSAGKDISILYPEFRQISVQYNPGFETGHWLFCNILLGDIIMCRC